MATNKVIFGNTTVMDISDTTAEAADVASGEVFYTAGGTRSVGTGDYYSPSDTAETTIDDADYFPFYDTSATAKRKTLWSNIKAKLKDYFDTIYATTYALAAKFTRNENNILGAKNMLPMGETMTIGNLTFTVQKEGTGTDGRVTVTGANTSGDKVYYPIYPSDGTFVKNNYAGMKLSGCTGGSSSTYYLVMLTAMSSTPSSFSETPVYDGEESVPLSLYIQFAICVCNNVSMGGKKFNPMLRLSIDPSTDYAPYAMTNRELTIAQFPRTEQQVLGARNLFPLPVKTTSSGNLTITASSDGSITLNTSAATVGNQGFTLSTFDLPTGQSYRASIDNALNKGDYAVLIFQGYNGSSWVDLGVIKDTNTSVTFSSGTYTSFKLSLVVSASQTFSNLTFSPMITLATDPDPSYTQYAMTNKQITAELAKMLTTTVKSALNGSTADCNDAPFGMVSVQQNVQNAPQAWCNLITIHADTGDANKIQIAIGFNNTPAMIIYGRRKNSGTWTAWKSVTLS